MQESQNNDLFSEAARYYRGLPGSQENIVAFLRETQEIYGYIPECCIPRIAEAMRIKLSFLEAVLKRFPSLQREGSSCEVAICTGPNCRKRGSEQLLRQARQIEKSGRNPVRVTACGCLHQCRSGPNCKIGSSIYGNMTSERLKSLMIEKENQ